MDAVTRCQPDVSRAGAAQALRGNPASVCPEEARAQISQALTSKTEPGIDTDVLKYASARRLTGRA